MGTQPHVATILDVSEGWGGGEVGLFKNHSGLVVEGEHKSDCVAK